MPSDFKVRQLTAKELPLAIEWAARENWNPGLNDAESFFAADSTGFFAGEFKGEIVSVISAVKYGADFGFVGLYIVRPEFRSKGFGLATWQQALHSLRGRNVGLDAVVEQQKTYERSGFKKAYTNIRFGVAASAKGQRQSVALSSIRWDEILAYDSAVFPADREAFLKVWLNQPHALALALVENGKLAGYGLIRPCRSGYKIGPLFANDPDKAAILFQDLTAHVTGEPIYLDTPEINLGAIALAERYGMKKVFETGRMYTSGVPPMQMDRVFGITSFELG